MVELGGALREMVHRANMTLVGVTRKAGYKTVSSISTPMTRGVINLTTLLRLADACGYDVMLVRRNPIEPEYPIRIDFQKGGQEEQIAGDEE